MSIGKTAIIDRRYSGNSEGRQLTATTVTVGTATYVYDGDGNRVKKISGGATTLYWYGAGGNVLTETDGSGGFQKDYIYFGGRRLAMLDSSSAKFYLGDQIGSARVITWDNGTMCADSDFLPFGQELNYSNSCAQNYKFTGMERDAETGNDNFGARYYASNLGRFLSVDPVALSSQKMADPQQLNMYSYVRDNPLKYIDPKGEELVLKCLGEEQRRLLIEKLQQESGLKLKYSAKSGLLDIAGLLAGGSNTYREGLKALIYDNRVFKVLDQGEYSSNGQTAPVNFGLFDPSTRNIVMDFRDFSAHPEVDLGLAFYHEGVAHGEKNLLDEAPEGRPFAWTSVRDTGKVGRELNIPYPESHGAFPEGDRYYIRLVNPVAGTTGGRIKQFLIGRSDTVVDITDIWNQK